MNVYNFKIFYIISLFYVDTYLIYNFAASASVAQWTVSVSNFIAAAGVLGSIPGSRARAVETV